MSSNRRLSAVAVALSTVLVACGGGSDSTSNLSVSNVAAANAAGTASAGTFFNANDGLNFARSFGGGLATLTNQVIESSPIPLADLTQSNDSVSPRMNNETGDQQCDSGSVSFSIGTDEAGEPENISFVFNDCVTDGETTSGSMSLTVQSSGTTDTITVTFDDFAVSGPDGNSSIDGAVRLSTTDDESANISGTRITMITDGETIEFTNFELDSQINEAAGTASLGGRATLSSSQDGQINLVIDPAFENTNDEDNPTSGALILVHEDGSSLTIDAATGNPDTFSYIINGGGSISSGIGNWDDEDFDFAVLN